MTLCLFPSRVHTSFHAEIHKLQPETQVKINLLKGRWRFVRLDFFFKFVCPLWWRQTSCYFLTVIWRKLSLFLFLELKLDFRPGLCETVPTNTLLHSPHPQCLSSVARALFRRVQLPHSERSGNRSFPKEVSGLQTDAGQKVGPLEGNCDGTNQSHLTKKESVGMAPDFFFYVLAKNRWASM